MKSRSHRVWREFLCAGMAFVMVAVSSIFPSSHTPVVQAQGGDGVITASDLQFDGSRYYYIVSMYVTNLSWSWQVFLNNGVEQIVTDTPLIGWSLDSSIFIEDLPGCFGETDCDQRCNACVTQGNRDCFFAAVGSQIISEIEVGVVCILCIAAAPWVILVIACVLACGVGLTFITYGEIADFRTCKAQVPGNCTNLNPGCNCKAIGT